MTPTTFPPLPQIPPYGFIGCQFYATARDGSRSLVSTYIRADHIISVDFGPEPHEATIYTLGELPAIRLDLRQYVRQSKSTCLSGLMDDIAEALLAGSGE